MSLFPPKKINDVIMVVALTLPFTITYRKDTVANHCREAPTGMI